MSETNFNDQPYHRRQRFNFEAFDQMLSEALNDTDAQMMQESTDLEEEQKWAEHDKMPGEIGGVICTPLFRQWFGDELPPDDAA